VLSYLFVEGCHRYFFSLLQTRSPSLSCYLRPQIIGRRPVLLSAIILFALGSTVCGGASSMNMLIAGRGSSCAFLAVRYPFKLRLNSYTGLGSWGDYFVCANFVVRFGHTSRAWNVQRYNGTVCLCSAFVSGNLLISCSSWAIGGGVGPVIGGAFSQSGNWYVPCWGFNFRSFSMCFVFPHRRWLFCRCIMISNVITTVNK
jgi:MFS family permease